MSTITLSGKTQSNILNLSGKHLLQNMDPLDVQNFKVQLMNKIILPLLTNKWKYLEENSFMLNIIMNKINSYYTKYKLPDLLIYKEFIKSYEIMINEHMQLSALQKKIYEDGKGNSIFYRTTMIKLKPEYELYNLIYGRPLKEKNEKYNENIIKEIRILININNIDFNKIKLYITNIYKTAY